MVYDTQMQGVMMMQAFSNPKKPWRINSEIGDMNGVCVSGVPLLEKKMKTSPSYRDYVERTPAFIPWFPRMKKPQRTQKKS